MKATEILRDYQKQIDPDGEMVGVNRQALDEVLSKYAELETALRRERIMGILPDDVDFDSPWNGDEKTIAKQKERIAELEAAARKVLDTVSICDCSMGGDSSAAEKAMNELDALAGDLHSKR